MNIDLESLRRLSFDAFPILLDAAVKGLVLLAVTSALVLAMRTASAAARQVVWLLALAALIVLPIASVALPTWGVLPGWVKFEIAEAASSPAATDNVDSSTVETALSPSTDPRWEANKTDRHAVAPLSGKPMRPGKPFESAVAMEPAPQTGSDMVSSAGIESATPAGTGRSWVVPFAVSAWLVGAIVCLLPLVLGRISLWRLAQTSRRITNGSWDVLSHNAAKSVGLRTPVRLFQSCDEPMPMVWGIVQPKLLLPVEAENWTPERRWVVLLHELAHARRRDCLAKLIAHVACSFYWFNPLCWIAFKLMQREAETACDDLVLNSPSPSLRSSGEALAKLDAHVAFTIRPSDYAQHLLEIASGLKSGMLAAYSSIAMARTSKLESRLLAILDAKRNRRALTRIGILIAVALVAAIAIPLAVLRAGLENFDFENPPAGYEKGVEVADDNQVMKISGLRFAISDVRRSNDGAAEVNLSIDKGYEVAEIRLFDHETRKFIYGDANQAYRVDETSRIRIEDSKAALPRKLDLWLRLQVNGKGDRVIIPAKEGAIVKHAGASITVIDLIRGGASGSSDPAQPERLLWNRTAMDAHSKGRQITIQLENTGKRLAGRYHLVAVAKDGRRYAMNHKHFLDFGQSRFQYELMDIPLDRIDHFELIPFKDRVKFFFNGVEVPESATQLAGKESHISMLMSDPPAIVAATPEQERRIRELVYVLQNYVIGSRSEQWMAAMKELVQIGKPAVPDLCAELLHTDRDPTIRAIAFTLRAIGDARAVPTLIQTLPKSPLCHSDCGLAVFDRDTHAFFASHQIGSSENFPSVGFRRAVREITAALERITSHSEEHDYLRGARSDSPEDLKDAQQKLDIAAKRWQKWWDENRYRFRLSQEYMDSVNTLAATTEKIEEAGVAKYGPRFPQGSGVSVSEVQERVLSKEGSSVKAYLDFDTGKQFYLMEDYQGESGSYDTTLWINQKGIDVYAIQIAPEDGGAIYGLQGRNTHVWQVPNDLWDSFEKRIQAGTITLEPPQSSDFYPYRKGQTPDYTMIPATFLFTTAEGSAGILQIVGVSDQPQGMRIRYRLVNAAPASQPSVTKQPTATTQPTSQPVGKPARPEDKPAPVENVAVPAIESDESPAVVQQMLELPVRVVDENGEPVADAKITPWALRDSLGGHRSWKKDDKNVGVGPKKVVTGKDGTATVLYPRYDCVQQQVHTVAVSLYVDHPKFAYVDNLHIDVPLESKGHYEIKLKPGVSVEIRPLINGKPTLLDDVYLLWSDGRRYLKDAAPEKLPGGTLRVPGVSPGKNSVLVVKLDGQQATHFSKIVDFNLTVGKPKTIDVELRPSLKVEGILSDNVPRPVRQGSIKVHTLPPTDNNHYRVNWFSWAEIRPDGTFTINWPVEEKMQLIALCDGYYATPGSAPDVVKNLRDPKKGPLVRPQVFDPSKNSRVTVKMSPLARCVATTVNENGEPIAGVNVTSWPNVAWWNSGSQIYGDSLVRGERLLHHRNLWETFDFKLPDQFKGTTNAQGKVTLKLPAGDQYLGAHNDAYELPVSFNGRRGVNLELVSGKTTEVTLRLQPSGTEKLGEWNKLGNVIFGHSMREGRLPEVQEKMNELRKQFFEAKNQRDPQLLSEAYTAAAEVFEGAGDLEEAAKWRKKASEQAAKVKRQ